MVPCQPKAGVEIARDYIVLGQGLKRGERQKNGEEVEGVMGCVHLCDPGMVHDIQEGWG